jgi:hypothetical protein
MTTILCRSGFLAKELARFAGPESAIAWPAGDETFGRPNAGHPTVSPEQWLSDCLREHNVSLVLYEPRFFIDPARFRAISPRTRFVVLASPGEEDDTQTALVCGACAAIGKPLNAQEVRGVLSLVTQ